MKVREGWGKKYELLQRQKKAEVMTWVSGRQVADTALMRFVRHRFFDRGTFLDIGSGSGANARELFSRGHRVDSIDLDPLAPVPIQEAPTWHHCVDVSEYSFEGPFDLIYDINTLCHVIDPPFEKIKNGLGPEGIFFSILPTNYAPKYVAEGKSYTRFLSEFEVRQMLAPFFEEIRIYWRCEPDFKGNGLESWIVEANCERRPRFEPGT